MKIVQVIQAFFPCQIWGGPPQNTYVLSKALMARGHDVHILTTNILDRDSRMREESFTDEWDGIPVTYLHAHWLLRRKNSQGVIVTPDVFGHRALIQQADVVHIHGYRHFLFTVTSMMANQYDTPVVVHPRGSLPSQFGRSWLKSTYDSVVGQMTIAQAAGGIALNDDERQRMIDAGVPAEHAVKILNPFDPSIVPQPPDGRRFREQHNIGAEDKVVLFLARLHVKKGVDLLIEAFSQLEDVHTRLVIVGPDDGFEAKARELITELDLWDRVLMPGALYKQDKFDAYAAADVYVLPTRGVEGLPTTVLEACYTQTPMIVTRTTEIARDVDGRIGRAIDFDVAQLATALRDLLGDDALRASYVAATTDFMREHFDVETAITRIEALYSACIQSKKVTATS